MEPIDFDTFLSKWSAYIEKVSGSMSDWAVPKDDIVQEARIVLWNVWKKYGAEYPNIDSIVKGAILNNLREKVNSERARLPLLTLDEDAFGGTETNGELVPGEKDIAYLPGPIRPLSEREQQVLTLKGIHGYSSAEIAEMLGISAHTVRRYWIRGKKKLAETVI